VPLDPTTPINADDADKVLFERPRLHTQRQVEVVSPEVEQGQRGGNDPVGNAVGQAR
jgi:hypothetical protein